MQQISRRRVMAAPAEAIWALLADFGAIATWAPKVTHSELISQADCGPGATRRVQAGRIVLLERVVDWHQGSELAYEITGLPKVVRRVENRWNLEANGTTTTVHLGTTVDAGPRPPQQLVAKVVAQVLARTSEELLAGMANSVEEAPR